MTASGVAVGLRVGIQELEELPPLPQNLQHLLEAATDDEVDIGAFAKLIEQDPAVTARVMGIANSAYFAQRVPVRSVADAIIRVLGLPLVKSLVVSIAVSGAFDPDRCPLFDAEKYWLKALLTAGLARTLARVLEIEERPMPDTAYLCGLLHEIGLLVLTHIDPQAMGEVFKTVRACPEKPLVQVEVDIIGLNHCDAGALMASRWHLPAEVSVTLEHQFHPEYSGPHWSQSALVGVCTHWADQQICQAETPMWDLASITKLGIALDALDDIVVASQEHMSDVHGLARLFSRAT